MPQVMPNKKAPTKAPPRPKSTKSSGTPSRKNLSPLAPASPQQLRREAMSTMRAIYKPAFKQLGREQSRMLSISEKRKADNQYYLNWLNNQSQQLSAHQDAANSALLAAGQAAGQELEKGYTDLRDHLVATGESTPGVVSNPGDATAFDVSAQAQRDRELVNAQRAQTQAQVSSGQQASDLAGANNFATIAAAEASRVGDQWKALSELGDAKTKLRLSRAADAAKETARLLDREIQKTQIRGQLSASQAQAALEAKRFGLDLKEFGLDASKLNFEQSKFNRKFGLEKREAAETKSYHEAQTALKGAKSREDKMKASHKITAVIQEGISTIASNKNLQKSLEKNPEKVKRRLMQILGSATAASAAVELVTTGKLNPTTRSDLKQIGYIVPPKWR